MRDTIGLALVLATFGCGGDSATGPTPTTAQVGGVWTFSSTLTSVSGGECFASTFQSLVGTRGTGTAQIQQSGPSVTATVTDDSAGSSCSYTGTAGSNSVALNVNSCTASDLIGATCPNGALRNIRLQTGGINATVNGGSMIGTSAETYNVTTSSGVGLGTLTFNYSFIGTRR
jgi:hypothetical protein